MKRLTLLSAVLLLSACRSATDAPTVTLSPLSPTTVDDLVAGVDNCDNCKYRWFKNNEAQGDITGDTVSASLTTKGESWSLLVTSQLDDGTEGLPGEAETVILNSLPELSGLALSATEVYTNDILTASIDASDADDEEISLSYSWLVDDVDVGVDADSLDGLVYFDKGQTVSVTVTAIDREGESQESSEVIDVLNSPPSMPVLKLSQSRYFGALQFDGTDDYVQVDADSSLEFGDAFTVEGWVRWDGTSQANYEMLWMTYWGDDDDVPFRFHVHNGTDCGASPGDFVLSWSEDRALGCENALYTSGLNKGQWHHVATVNTDKSWRVYVDGVEVASATGTESAGVGKGSQLSIGGLFDLPTNTPFGGSMAQLRITHAEVYTKEFTPEFPLSDLGDTALLYGFTEGQGAQLLDLSGNGNDGAISGALWTEFKGSKSDLVCSVLEEAEDLDGDEITYTFAWDVDGTDFLDTETTEYEGDTVPEEALKKEETWTCRVTPNDGEEDGEFGSADYKIDDTCSNLQGGVQFDGDSDWVSVPSLNYTGDRTLELWMLWEPWRAPNYDSGNVYGIENAWHQVFGGTCSALAIIEGRMAFHVFPGCNGTSTTHRFEDLTFDPSVFEEGWVHMAIVTDGSSTAELFINGVSASTDTSSSDSQSGKYGGGIGAWQNDGVEGRYMPVVVGEFRISDTQRYQADFKSEAGWVSDSDTVVLYAFDEGSGQTVVDQSGAGLNGTLSGGEWIDACTILEDGDGDGFPAWQDCDDEKSSVYPFAGDVSGDNEDSDCDGMDCDADFMSSGVYYAVCPPTNTSWADMQGICNRAGYDGLASVRDASENADLQALGKEMSGLWGVALGGSDVQSEGNWIWLDGADFNYESWGSVHYGGGTVENCVEMDLYDYPGDWNDCPCSWVGPTTAMACQAR